MNIKITIALVLSLVYFGALATASVVGIDLGLQNIKGAYLKPGLTRPELLLNELSKRKTPAFVGFKNDERLFGDNAALMATRYPESMFTMLQRTLGKRFDSDLENMFNELNYAYKFATNELRNGSVEFVVDEERQFSPEELVGMLLEHVRGLVKSNTGTLIKDFAITVPSFFTVEQKQAVADAAALADVNVLSLVPEHQAVALQYGISKRKFSEPINVLFVDIGAGSMTTFVATFTPPKEKKSKTLGNIAIKSMAWDTTLGGIDFDARIANHLAQLFKEKFYAESQENPILSNTRAMAKLMKAANKAKEVLSANQDTIVSVESLFEEKDFSVTLKRETFEQMCADLFDRIKAPVKRAIEDSGIPVSNLTSVELVGGATRVPRVQSLLKEVTEKNELSFSLNADEALVIGATYAGARLSPMFRVKSFTIEDLFPQDVIFQLSPRPDQVKEEKFRTLFPVNSAIPSKKSIVVPRKDDFSVSFAYGENTKLSGRENSFLMKVDVSGVKEALATNNTSEQESEMLSQKSKIKVAFHINKNGIVVLDSARVEFEETFKQKQEIKVENETTASENKKINDGTKTLVRRVPLGSSVSNFYLVPLTKEHMKHSREKFNVFRKKEEQKRRAAKALNELESFLYTTRDKLEDDEEYEMVTTEEERESILEKLRENSEWLMFENDDTDLNHTKYEERLRPLQDSVNRITHRIHEMNYRPEAVKTCEQTFNLTRTFLQNHTAIAPYSTEEERAAVADLCDEVEQWLKEKLAVQEKIPPHENPIVTADEIHQRCGEPMMKLRRLSLKPKPKPKKKTIPVNETQESEDESAPQESSEEAPAQEEAEKPQEPSSQETSDEKPASGPEHDEL